MIRKRATRVLWIALLLLRFTRQAFSLKTAHSFELQYPSREALCACCRKYRNKLRQFVAGTGLEPVTSEL